MNKLLVGLMLVAGIGSANAASSADVIGAAIGGMVLHHVITQERTVPQNVHSNPQPQVIYQAPPVYVQQAPVFPAGTCFQQMVDINGQPVTVRIPCPVR